MQSKCAFGEESISYLGHIISSASVVMDLVEVQAIAEWPRPHSAHVVRGFLGLAGYYRKFVQDYDIIATSLTALLRKERFIWMEAATTAFDALKAAITMAPILVVNMASFAICSS
jgi:hypothetical protein